MDTKEPEASAPQLPPHLAELADALHTAKGAEPVEAVHPVTGEPVKHLRIRLNAADTKRVMSMPPQSRSMDEKSVTPSRFSITSAHQATTLIFDAPAAPWVICCAFWMKASEDFNAFWVNALRD